MAEQEAVYLTTQPTRDEALNGLVINMPGGAVLYAPDWSAAASLHAKAAAVAGAVGRIAKEGVNKQERYSYNYARYEDIVGPLNSAMAEQKLAVYSHLESAEATAIVSSTNAHGTYWRGTYRFILADGETGAMLVTTWQGEATDYSDKGLNKLSTAAQKYWILRTFHIATSDEADADEEGGEHQGTRVARQQQSVPEAQAAGIRMVAEVIAALRYGYDEIKRKGPRYADDPNKLASYRGFVLKDIHGALVSAGKPEEEIDYTRTMALAAVWPEIADPHKDMDEYHCRVINAWLKRKDGDAWVMVPNSVQELLALAAYAETDASEEEIPY